MSFINYDERPALKALTALWVSMCEATGAGKGRDTTPEAIAALEELTYQRREEFASHILDAEKELRNLPPQPGRTGHTNGRYYIEGLRGALERVTRP